MLFRQNKTTVMGLIILSAVVLYWLITLPINNDISAIKQKRKQLDDEIFSLEEQIGDFQIPGQRKQSVNLNTGHISLASDVMTGGELIPLLLKVVENLQHTDLAGIESSGITPVVDAKDAPDTIKLYRHGLTVQFSSEKAGVIAAIRAIEATAPKTFIQSVALNRQAQNSPLFDAQVVLGVYSNSPTLILSSEFKGAR